MSAKRTLADWQAKADALAINGKAFINGEYVDAASGKTFDCINPATGKVLVKVAECDEQDADIAVSHARASFERGDWRRLAPAARKRVLQKFAQLILAHREELALLETLDMGKPITDSFKVDVPGAANCVAWNAEAIDKIYDEIAPTPEHQLAMVTREPIGVVAAIVPWNFPLLMASWKFAPALATGNSVILKPSEKSPLTAIRVAELAAQAGIPAGVFQVLPGFGQTVGKALALHPEVDCIAFTGSTGVGKQLMQYAGQSNMKRVWLEAGGKSPNIVFADCPDLEAAAKAAALACFYNQGEVCVAGTRLLVERSIKDTFIDKVREAAQALRPGNPLDPQTRMGAIVDQQQMEKVQFYIQQGQQEGAQLFSGGRRACEDSGGFFVEPTIFDNARNDMKIAREEIFGPVMAVIPFDSEAEAIRIANDTPYGLAAALWTSDLNRAHRVARELRAGSVWVNNYNEGDMTVPFGGFKQSGNGRDKSLHALEKYTELKTTLIQLG